MRVLAELGLARDGVEAVARPCKCRFGTISVGDVVGLRDGGEAVLVGEVVLLLRWSGQQGSHAIMSLWERDGATAAAGHTWRMRAACRGMSPHETSAIDDAFIYSRDSPTSDVAMVVVPPKWR